jgi:small-conductance mechanosensitive channel
MPNVDFQALLAQLTAPAGLAQIGALATAILLAWLLARALRAKIPDQRVPGLAKIGAGSAHRMVFPLALLIFAWSARFALAKWQAVPLLNIAIPLIAAFAAISLAVYLLRHLLKPSAALKASERVIVYGVWLLFALHITGLLGEVATALDEVSFSLGKKPVSLLLVLQALAAVVVTIFVALGLSSVIESRLMKVESIDMSARVVMTKFLRAVVLALGILVALSLIGFDLTLLSVFSGALGVGLGFGLQKIASNYISGFIILLDKSIRIGDTVTVDGRTGVVDAIRARYTVIKGGDGVEAIVPNDTLITSTVTNATRANPKTSIKSTIFVAPTSNLEQVCELMLTSTKEHVRALQEPAPAALIKGFAERGVEIDLTFWIEGNTDQHAAIRSDVLMNVWRNFQQNGVSVSFAQPASPTAPPTRSIAT